MSASVGGRNSLLVKLTNVLYNCIMKRRIAYNSLVLFYSITAIYIAAFYFVSK